LNADLIAHDLLADGALSGNADIAASREMLRRMEQAIRAGADLMFETTLASRHYATRIPIWRALGFIVVLVYLRLSSAEISIDRVRRRVASGGHGIPEATIRQRYERSLANLDKLYKPIVDEWYVWDSLENDFQPADAWNR
jgi:predicted ABC-type ATPase